MLRARRPDFHQRSHSLDTGSTVVLTGVGAKGQVGEVVARAFADLGASLVLVDRTTTNVDARAAELTRAGHAARGYACDLTNADAVASLADDVRRESRRPRWRARSHGRRIRDERSGRRKLARRVASADRDQSHDGVPHDARVPADAARGQGRDRALRVGGGAARLGRREQVGVRGRENWRRDAHARRSPPRSAKNGVRANALAPTSIRTAANVAAMGEGARYIEREEVAAVVTFLCSDAASAITGELLPLT